MLNASQIRQLKTVFRQFIPVSGQVNNFVP